MIVRSFLLLFSSLLATFSQSSQASIRTEQIYAAVKTFLSSHQQHLLTQYGSSVRVDYEISRLDPRLSMADCAQPLTAVLQSNSKIGRINIKVSCEKGSPWSLYVPAHVKLYRAVVVTTAPVARLTALSKSLLELRELDVSTLRGSYFTDIKRVIGMQAKRALLPDVPVTANQIEPPIIVKKGEMVLITANSGSLIVKTPAKALMDGRLGQQISVQNRRSKRIVDATVVAPGRVEVPM